MFLNQSCQALARTLWGSVIVFFLFNGMLPGQTNAATIEETVKDSSGAPVAGATVIVQNTATGVQQQSRTNDAGVYSVRQLQPGTYSVPISTPASARLVTRR